MHPLHNAAVLMLCMTLACGDTKCGTSIVKGVGYTAGGKWYNTTKVGPSPASCCLACMADKKCGAWTHHSKSGQCSLAVAVTINKNPGDGTTSGSKHPLPKPTPTPVAPTSAPTPVQPLGPVLAGSPNIVLFLTDDQDATLGGWDPMHRASAVLAARGASATHWVTHTPVCCPSRTQLLSGRYFHNVKTATPSEKGCMHCRLHHTWADEQLFAPHLRAAGYRVGVFGKYLNNDNPVDAPPGVATWFGNGGGNYINPWFSYDAEAGDGRGGKTVKFDNASAPGAAYSTSVIGNVSLPWISDALADHKSTGRPFMAYIAPKAPHIQDGPGWPITIPAPWHSEALPHSTQAPRTPSWNYSATDHHWMIAQQPPMTLEQANRSDMLFRARHQSLLAVDDLVAAVVAEVESAGALGNTYFLYTSDHGFRLGQFRMPEGKWNVYENDIRIPMVIAGPGITPNSTFDHVASNVDVMPTVLGLAGIETPNTMDGRSFAPEIIASREARNEAGHAVTLLPARTAKHVDRAHAAAAAGARAPWRESQLIEYYGLGNVVRYEHLEDTYNNTFRAIRRLRRDPATGRRVPAGTPWANVLYAEFTDVQTDWNFTAQPYFYELFDLDADPHMLHNTYEALQNDTLKAELHGELMASFKCRGSPDTAGATGDCN